MFIPSLGNVSNTYKAWTVRILKRFWEDVLEEKFPLRKGEGPRTEVHPQPYVTTEEVSQLLNVASSNKRDYAIIQVLIDTLIRRDELCNLNRDDYRDGSLQIRLSKREGYRTVRLSEEAKEALNAYLKSRRDQNLALFTNFKDSGRIKPYSVTLMLKKYFKELGIGKLGKAGHAIRRGGVT